MSRVQAAIDDIFAACLARGGTLSGEHGIGLLKRRYMPKALPPETLDVMRRLKALFDPDNLLNPGKVFPDGAVEEPLAGRPVTGPTATPRVAAEPHDKGDSANQQPLGGRTA